MMKLNLLFLLPILLFTAACSPAEPEMLVLTEDNAGETVDVQQDQVFQVSLEGNLTTGYNWVMAPQDPALLEQQGDPEYKAASNLVGSPGTVTFTLKALTPGETTLHFDYKRPWEETTTPEKTYEVTITVK
jgi:inhibitor of cysteine peptidase